MQNQMEIEGKDGSKIPLQERLKTDFGRGLGLKIDDRTVSRRHVSFQPHPSEHKDETKVCFKVIGKNPIWVCSQRTGQIRVLRRLERGEIESGDMFCVSAKNPVWFTLKRIDFDGEEDDKNEFKSDSRLENEFAESLQSSSGLIGVEELELESVNVSDIDPVKEFGFVVMGHEFDCYPKKLIREIKNWEWFLEEPGEESNDDEVQEKRGKKVGRRKRKRGEGNDDDYDDEWAGESEDEEEVSTKTRKVQRPKYSTRSKDGNKAIKNTRKTKYPGDEEYIEEDDDTLGGFVVTDDDVELEDKIDEDEEEDDFDEEDDEDD
ncbi:unnamed protein product [Ilex paraguariensis]|uniref:FHA domain-containing protein n=1 Tax=Ilex paraguariensis TaxID=185542 RepID=A0ABC8UG03_9AQUA